MRRYLLIQIEPAPEVKEGVDVSITDYIDQSVNDGAAVKTVEFSLDERDVGRLTVLDVMRIHVYPAMTALAQQQPPSKPYTKDEAEARRRRKKMKMVRRKTKAKPKGRRR